ncbi:MAG: hypothetical protein M9962_14315 [Oligoflexia bacterium]|nr:hypothetical protein [Oligoflexia bacterium]
MKTLLFTLSFLLLPMAEAKDFTICYFSLNNEKEYGLTKKFMNQLNKVSTHKIAVKEFLIPETEPNPEKAFTNMIKSGEKCDGLVVSGHHTGAFGGKRAKGKLSLDFLEKISCNPEYAPWFKQINALWLQGCRTLGVGDIETEPNQEQFSADFHTERVGNDLEADGLEQSFADLDMEFSTTLDQDNPLSTRYMRIFPNSKVFGWTKSAPGEKTKSERSFLYHMAHIARLMQKSFPEESPLSDNLSTQSASQFASAVLVALSKYEQNERGCEELSVDAWLNHGHVNVSQKYTFDNSDLKAFAPLSSSGDRILFEAKKIDCLLKEAIRLNDKDKLVYALDTILAQPDFLRYSFNSIVDLHNEAKAKKDATAEIIIERMKLHPTLATQLQSKFTSEQVGILRKMEFYAFYKALMNQKDDKVERIIQSKVIDILSKPLPEGSDRTRTLAANYRATIVQSLIKNRISSIDFFPLLLTLEPQEDVLISMARNAQASAYTDTGVRDSLLKIVGSPNSSEKVLATAEKILKKLKLSDEEKALASQNMLAALNNRPGPSELIFSQNIPLQNEENGGTLEGEFPPPPAPAGIRIPKPRPKLFGRNNENHQGRVRNFWDQIFRRP